MESSADIDIGKMYRENPARFGEIAREKSDRSYQQAIAHPLHAKLKKHADIF